MFIFNVLFFNNFDTFDEVTRTDEIDNLKTFDDASKTGVDTIEMLGVGAVVTDEELAAARVLAGMSHGKDTTVVILHLGLGLALDSPTRTTSADTWVSGIAAIGATALYDEIGDDTMETKAIVESRF